MSLAYGMKDGKMQFYKNGETTEEEIQEELDERYEEYANDEDEEGIILSKKHGVNPSIEICSICGKDMGIIMFGKLKDDIEAPRQICLGHICDDCQDKFRKEHKRIFMEISEDGFTGRAYAFPENTINPSVLKDMGDDIVVYLSDKSFRELEQNIKELEEEYAKNNRFE